MAHIKCRYKVQYCNHDLVGCGGTKCPIDLEIEDYVDCPHMAPKKVGDWSRVINPPCVWVSCEILEFEKDYKTYELESDCILFGTRRRIDRKDIVYCEIDGRVLFDDEQTDCNGCKFVGTYDTEFPCANCSRKTKDYYAKTEPQTYVINPQEPTNDDKCFECDDFFTCGGQCNKIEDEPQTESTGSPIGDYRDGVGAWQTERSKE